MWPYIDVHYGILYIEHVIASLERAIKSTSLLHVNFKFLFVWQTAFYLCIVGILHQHLRHCNGQWMMHFTVLCNSELMQVVWFDWALSLLSSAEKPWMLIFLTVAQWFCSVSTMLMHLCLFVIIVCFIMKTASILRLFLALESMLSLIYILELFSPYTLYFSM